MKSKLLDSAQLLLCAIGIVVNVCAFFMHPTPTTLMVHGIGTLFSIAMFANAVDRLLRPAPPAPRIPSLLSAHLETTLIESLAKPLQKGDSSLADGPVSHRQEQK